MKKIGFIIVIRFWWVGLSEGWSWRYDVGI